MGAKHYVENSRRFRDGLVPQASAVTNQGLLLLEASLNKRG